MLISVKYALDAQNNVGIFTADLNLGEMAIAYREERDGLQYQVALINDADVLYVKVNDPDRKERDETEKVRKKAAVNEVFSVGSATFVIVSISGESKTESPLAKAPKVADPIPSLDMQVPDLIDMETSPGISLPADFGLEVAMPKTPLPPLTMPPAPPPLELEVETSSLKLEVETSSLKLEVEPPPLEAELAPPPLELEVETSSLKLEVEPPPLEVELAPPPLKTEAGPPPPRMEAAAAPGMEVAAVLKMEVAAALKMEAPPPPLKKEVASPAPKMEAPLPPVVQAIKAFAPRLAPPMPPPPPQNKKPTPPPNSIAASGFGTPVPIPVQIGPDEDSQVFHTDPGLTPSGTPPPPMREVKASEAKVSNPPKSAMPGKSIKPLFPDEEDDGDTLSRKMRENMGLADPAALPSVDGSRLNFNPQFDQNQKSVLLEGKTEIPQKAPPRPKVEYIQPRSRAQLLTEDVRDRRFFLKGAKYSLRNKISALILCLGVIGIGGYSVGASRMAEKSQETIFADAIFSQGHLRYEELKNRLMNYNVVLNSMIQIISQEKLDYAAVSKGYEKFEFMVGVGVFKFLPASEVETPAVTLPVATIKKVPVRAAMRTPAQMVTPPAAPKYDLSKLKKLDDGNYLQPMIQWTRAIEANALQLDQGNLQIDQLKKLTEILSRKASPEIFDYTNMTLPPPEKGVYTYVVRVQPVSPVFIVLQTSSRYFAEVFRPANNMDYYLVNNTDQILFPESARTDRALRSEIASYLKNGNRKPSSENAFNVSFPVTPGVEFVARPNALKSLMAATDTKVFQIFAAGVLLAFLVIGVLFAKNISSPLQNLVLQIESVAAGDYHKRFAINSNDEIGQVSDYFEHLSSTLRRKEQELARVTDLASKDSLTGLYNHRHLRSHLESKWKEVEAGRGGSLILIDIDDFRIFNQSHGHIQGDLVLKELSHEVLDTVKGTGLVARYGGEEIVVWVPGYDQRTSFELAELIQKRLRAHKTQSLTGGSPVTVTCSLGVTTFTKGRHLNIDQFLNDADTHLIMAKKAGKNRIWAGVAS